MVPEIFTSSYVFSSVDRDGTTWIIDGKNAEKEFGTIGHFINSDVVEADESLFPVSFVFAPELNGFKVVANFDWDSGKLFVCFPLVLSASFRLSCLHMSSSVLSRLC